MNTLIDKSRRLYAEFCRTAYLKTSTGLATHANSLLLIVGAGILAVGLADLSIAQTFSDEPPGVGVSEGDGRIFEVTARMFELIEGNLGSLVMVAAGLAAIVSAAFGAYRAAIGLLVVAVGAFILRSLVDIFFDFE